MIKATIPSNDFYRAFEEKHRGSRELIKSRLRAYLPFVEKLKDFDFNLNAIDLGCGRGEWLELLSENGYKVQGVDLDAGMLEACQSRGFDVTQKDAIQALQELPNNSFNIVSGFHIAEHLPFDVLQLLVEESLRVLKPGGFLILETPNPENIKVATEYFYLDPTHIRPIPQELLSFLVEYCGFKRTKILRLQESKELHYVHSVTLYQVIDGVSADYAVVAQKQASDELLSNFDTLFLEHSGLSLHALAHKFENRLSSIQAQATQAQAQATQAQAQATQAWQHYIMVVNSRSWKVTKPLRIAGKIARWFVLGATAWLTFSPASRPRRELKKTLIMLENYISTKPKLKMTIIRFLKYFPALRAKLKKVAQHSHMPSYRFTDSEHLAPRVNEMYQNLKIAIRKKQQKVK